MAEVTGILRFAQNDGFGAEFVKDVFAFMNHAKIPKSGSWAFYEQNSMVYSAWRKRVER